MVNHPSPERGARLRPESASCLTVQLQRCFREEMARVLRGLISGICAVCPCSLGRLCAYSLAMNACSSSSCLSFVCNCEASSNISDHDRNSAIQQRQHAFREIQESLRVEKRGIGKESYSFNRRALRSLEIEIPLGVILFMISAKNEINLWGVCPSSCADSSVWCCCLCCLEQMWETGGSQRQVKCKGTNEVSSRCIREYSLLKSGIHTVGGQSNGIGLVPQMQQLYHHQPTKPAIIKHGRSSAVSCVAPKTRHSMCLACMLYVRT